MNNVEIKRVTPNDINQLQEISRQTFLETYATLNTEENMTKYLEESFSLEMLTAELNDDNSEFYFAILNNRVTGYIKLNFGESQTDLEDDKALEIERIYVSQEFHGRMIGRSLCEKAVQIARERSLNYVWLGVWEENPKAIAFYKKNGFVEFSRHTFLLGNDVQNDIMMKLQLKN